MAAKFSNTFAKGTAPWPPDSWYDPCLTGHSTERYRDDRGRWCCRRCGAETYRVDR